MNIEFTDEQKMLANMVEKFTADQYDVLKRQKYLKEKSGFSAKNWAVMAETGLLTIPISEESGGSGGSAADLISVMQPFGRAVAVEPMLSCAVFAGHFLDIGGTPKQKKDWVSKIMNGSKHIAIAHSEHNARYDLGYVTTGYNETKIGFKLTGHKTFVLGAGAADAYIISAIPQGGSSDDRSSIRFFIIEDGINEISKRTYRLTDGSVACELDLHGISAAPMDATFEEFLQSVALTKIGACAEMVGLTELLFDKTVDYVKTREQFGKPLAKFQVIQHRLSDAYCKLELSRSHLINLASLCPDDDNYHKTISGTKASISKTALEIAEEAIQLHGGMGVSDEMLVGQALKRVLVLSTLFGDVNTEMQRYS